MGLEFQKDLLMASGEIQATSKKELTKMQVKKSITFSIFVHLLKSSSFINRNVWSKNLAAMLIHSLMNCRKMPRHQWLFSRVPKPRENHAELSIRCGSLSESQWTIGLTRGEYNSLVHNERNEKQNRLIYRSSVSMGIRVIQYAPSQQQGRQPCTVVRRDFVLSPGDLEMELNLDKQVLLNSLFFK